MSSPFRAGSSSLPTFRGLRFLPLACCLSADFDGYRCNLAVFVIGELYVADLVAERLFLFLFHRLALLLFTRVSVSLNLVYIAYHIIRDIATKIYP